MIGELRPYPDYRKTDLSWLDRLPEQWQVLRAKSVFHAIDKRSATGTEELLTVSSTRGVVPRSTATVTMFKAKSYVGHKLCWPGDLAVNSLWAWMQGLGFSKHHGLISSAYSVYRPRTTYTDYWQYLHALLRSDVYKWELLTRSKGVWTSRLQLSDVSFMDMPILLPPPDEQADIARFLDHENRRIDRAIRAKKKLIALLNEQKQAIIHQAVTRGLDPTVPLKPSGIPWLGDIPQHWKTRRISHVAKVGNGSTPSRAKSAYWGGTYPWLNSSQVNRSPIQGSDQFITKQALDECHLPKVSPGSLLVAITGQGKTRGKAAVLAIEATINQHIAFVTLKTPVVSTEFLHLVFGAAYRPLRAISEDAGSTKAALTCEDIKRFRLVHRTVNPL